MSNKFTNYLIWAFIAIVLLGTVWWVILQPIIWWNPESELRLYIRLFLLLFIVNTFAVLRLYNSIVQNTRFAIKLREVMVSFTKVIPGLERSMKNLNSTLGNVKSSAESLRKNVSDNTDAVEALTEKIIKGNKQVKHE